jgi:hypothetical protein
MSPRAAIINKIYDDNHALIEYLAANGEVSFQSEVDNNFRKTLLLSAASYFEAILKDSLIEFFQEQTGHSDIVVRFIENKAMERQYHTFFSWDGNNANSFFGLFGAEFKKFMQTEVKNNKELDEAVRAFLKLGSMRNQLVHQNFAIFPLESTADEIFALCQKALLFIDSFPQKLREYIEKNPQ